MNKQKNTMRGHGLAGGMIAGRVAGGNNLTVSDAVKMWNEKFPNAPVTAQTIRNWTRKFGFGHKDSFLPRSHWSLDKKQFLQFLKDPKKFLCKKDQLGK